MIKNEKNYEPLYDILKNNAFNALYLFDVSICDNFFEEKIIKKYYTIINGYAYTISFEKTSELDKLNEETMKDIVDTIEFKVDEKSKEKNTKHSTKKIFLDSFADGFLGAGIAFLVLTIVEVIRKKKNKNKDEENR